MNGTSKGVPFFCGKFLRNLARIIHENRSETPEIEDIS